MTTMNGGKNGVRHDIDLAEHREWLRRFDLQCEADAGDPIAQRQLERGKKGSGAPASPHDQA